MAGIPAESSLDLRESLGSSHNRLTSAEDYARGFTFGLSARRSFGREECIPCRTERPTPAYPGLNAGACAHHGVNSRLINDSFNKSQHPKFPYGLTIGVFRGETGHETSGYAKSNIR